MFMASDKALYDLCDRSSAIALMRALVMTSVVLRRVRNRLRIIIIIIIICQSYYARQSPGPL